MSTYIHFSVNEMNECLTIVAEKHPQNISEPPLYFTLSCKFTYSERLFDLHTSHHLLRFLCFKERTKRFSAGFGKTGFSAFYLVY